MTLFDTAGLPDPSPVMAATRWRDNSEMILDARKLGYLTDDDLILDPTYGDGSWWVHWRPLGLITNSLVQATPADLCADFRAMPFPPETFDVIAYDPPYIAKGGRHTSDPTMQEHQRRYGIDHAPRSPALLQTLIDQGTIELGHLLKPKGIMFIKCQDYVSSGRIWWGADNTRQCAQLHRLNPIDRFYFINNGSAQAERGDKQCPSCRGKGCVACGNTGQVESKQQHARNNVSTLWVFRKGG